MEYERKRSPTREEREAKRDKARSVAEKNIVENRKLDAAFRANYERLKAERLEREKALTRQVGDAQ